YFVFFFSSRRRHTRCYRDWSSDVCSSDLLPLGLMPDEFVLGALDALSEHEAERQREGDDQIEADDPDEGAHEPVVAARLRPDDEIGRASCRERVWVSGGAVG